MKTIIAIVILLFFALLAIGSFIVANAKVMEEILDEVNNKNNTTDNK